VRAALVPAALALSALPLRAGERPLDVGHDAPLHSVADEAFQAIAQFYDYDRELPLDARVVGRDELPDAVREKIVFDGVRDSRVPALLGIPKAGSGPHPLVLQIDGLTGSKDRWWEEGAWSHGGELTHALLALGIAVLAIDAQYHGERGAGNDFASPGDMSWGPEPLPNRFREMVVQSTVEARRALDYAATRSEIDASRIGVIGISMGGIMTFALAGLDPRVSAAVACVTPPRTASALAPQTFAPRVRAPFLMLMGRADDYYDAAQTRTLYGLLGSASKDLVVYDGGHQLPAEYTQRAVAWLARHLHAGSTRP
jgi:dienelactone hydrolase